MEFPGSVDPRRLWAPRILKQTRFYVFLLPYIQAVNYVRVIVSNLVSGLCVRKIKRYHRYGLTFMYRHRYAYHRLGTTALAQAVISRGLFSSMSLGTKPLRKIRFTCTSFIYSLSFYLLLYIFFKFISFFYSLFSTFAFFSQHGAILFLISNIHTQTLCTYYTERRSFID